MSLSSVRSHNGRGLRSTRLLRCLDRETKNWDVEMTISNIKLKIIVTNIPETPHSLKSVGFYIIACSVSTSDGSTSKSRSDTYLKVRCLLQRYKLLLSCKHNWEWLCTFDEKLFMWFRVSQKTFSLQCKNFNLDYQVSTYDYTTSYWSFLQG